MESWNCPSCTYSNAKVASACEICGLTSPAVLSLFAQSENNDVIFHAAGPSTPDRWLCLYCNASNELQYVVCAVCFMSPREKLKAQTPPRNEWEEDVVPPECVPDVTSQPTKQSIASTSSSATSSASSSSPSSSASGVIIATITSTTTATTPVKNNNTTNTTTTSPTVAAMSRSPIDLTLSPADVDSLLVEVLSMNCGFEVSDICEAIRKMEGSVSALAVVSYLNKGAEGSDKQLRDMKPRKLDCKEDEEEDDEALNDFVLTEYIRDFAALVPNLLNQVDEFSVLMASLGVKSSRDRSRAFNLLESIMREKEDNCLALFLTEDEAKSKSTKRLASSELADLEFARSLEGDMDSDNVFYQDFTCSTCNQPRQKGVLLNNCAHCLCPSCIQTIVDRGATEPKCGECGIGMHVNDIRAACGREIAEKMAEEQTRGMVMAGGGVQCLALCGNVMSFHKNNLPRTPYACEFCKALNCFQCNVIHTSHTCAQYAALVALKAALKPLLATDTPTTEQWDVLRTAFYSAQTAQLQAPELTVATDMMKLAPLPPRPSSEFFKCWAQQKTPFHLVTVPPECLEYKTMSQRLTGGYKKIISCQRIQNPGLWENYQRYVAQHPDSEEGYYWHGTRTSHPKVIYEKAGFDKKFSRVGNCLWFAVQSAYSMSGFQHVAQGQSFVILALVAHTKRNDHVKFIRGDQILNVYENSCTYPAYLVTYQ